MELKKLTWTQRISREERRKYPNDFLMIHAYVYRLRISVYIQNWTRYKTRTNQPEIEKDTFYFYHSRDRGCSRKVKCRTLEEAKKMAENHILSVIREYFFEPLTVRKVLVEKSKKKSRKKIVRRPPVRLNQGMQPINNDEMWVSAL